MHHSMNVGFQNQGDQNARSLKIKPALCPCILKTVHYFFNIQEYVFKQSQMKNTRADPCIAFLQAVSLAPKY